MKLIGVSIQGRPVGEFVHGAKLTFEKVAEMRRLRAKHGLSYAKLGKQFGICSSTAHRVIEGKNWITPIAKQIRQAEDTDLQQIVATGTGCHTTARALAATPSSVYQVMKRNGVRRTGPAAENAQKEKCAHGHPLAGENLYRRPDGARGCRACRREADLRHKQKLKAMRLAPKE